MSSRFSEHFHLNVRKHRLPNGLTVLLYEDHRLPQVAVNVWYHVGSKDEVPGKTGFAHLFEHMMFQGSEHFPDDYFKPLEEIGARLNGSTSEDRTNYWEVVPSAYLERALWMEADRMGYLLPAVDQPKLDNQRDVVKNERRQTLENEPYGISEEILPPILFPRNHPYHHSVIGSMEDLDSATLEDVKDFFRKYYAPNNASLCVAGDMDPDRALSLVNTYFSGIPSGPVVSPVEPWLPALSRPERAEATDRVQLPRLYLAWPTPRQFTPDDAALAVLGSILSVGRDSRLVKRLQLDSDLAQSVGAFQMSGEVCSTFMAILTAQPGRSIDALEDATWEELNRISEDGVTEFELKASVDSLRARMTKRLQVVGGFGGISDILNHYQTFRDDPGALVRDLERLEALTPDAIRDAARTWLPYSGHAAVKITPAAEQKDALDRSVMPGPEGEGVFRFPEMERRTLGNGLEVWVLPQSGLPYVTVQATIRAGASSDPDDLPGLAEFTANLMDEGAAGLGTLELSRRFKELATSLAVDVNRDDATFTMGLLTEHFQGGVSLLADVLLRPDFHEPDMERRRREHLADLVRSLDEAPEIGRLTIRALLYGDSSAFGHPMEGTPGSIRRITSSDIRTFYRAAYRPDKALLTVVGDVSPDTAFSAIEKAFSNWQADGEARRLPEDSEWTGKKGLHVVDKPGAPQSYITLGVPALKRTDEGYPAFLVFNAVLGGQFTSRVNMNLREDKGYTYGAHSAVSVQAGVMPWLMATSVQTDKTAESLVEIRREILSALGDRPVGAKEFENARNNLVLRYPQAFETQRQLAENAGVLWTYHLPADYFETRLQQLKELTLDDVNKAARDVLQPGNISWLVVGDWKNLEKKLSTAGLGQAELVQAPGE